MLKRFRKKAEGSGIDIEVVFIERTGFSLQNQLEQADPYKGPDCERKCFPCEDEGQGDCEKRGAGYGIDCQQDGCSGHYDGETGRNAFTRGEDHARGYSRREKGNPLWEHDKEYHGGEGKTEYKMTVGRTYGRDNRRRVMNEAVRIEMNLGIRMNRKGEFRSSVLPRLGVHRGAEVT